MHDLYRMMLALALMLSSLHAPAQELAFDLADDAEIIAYRYPAEGEYLLLWLAPEYGFRKAHRLLAEQLAAAGIEVWQSDIAESLFLPHGARSLKQLDGRYVADLIERAHAVSGKKVAIAGDSYAAINALRGARRWQEKALADPYLVGAVLFTPYSYAYLPPLGLPPEYLPVVEATNIPLMIYQAKNSATYIRFDQLLQMLRKNESPIYTRLVPDVMSLFYEEEPTAAMIENAKPIAANLKTMLALLSRHGLPQRPVELVENTSADSGVDIYLKQFRASVRPTELALFDMEGRHIVKKDFSGQVTLINFWATWCPPCIEEIPSLNRLQRKMAGRPFELISINYAQDRATVAEFLERVEVDFPVLLDRDGVYAKRWNVISYPSTFVIDPLGNIRYGVNAAIEWDAPELIQKLDELFEH